MWEGVCVGGCVCVCVCVWEGGYECLCVHTCEYLSDSFVSPSLPSPSPSTTNLLLGGHGGGGCGQIRGNHYHRGSGLGKRQNASLGRR